MSCVNCERRSGEPVTVAFPEEEKRVSTVLCSACRDVFEDAPRCRVQRSPLADGIE